MREFVWAIIGGVIGLVLSVAFDEPLRDGKRKLRKWLKKLFFRKPSRYFTDTFAFGSRRIPFVVVDGDGELTYWRDTVACRILAEPAEKPAEVQSLYRSIEERERAKTEAGSQAQWNGPLLALDDYAIGRTIPEENLKVTFTFRPSDYFTFQATVMSIDKNLFMPPAFMSLRQKFLEGIDLTNPIPFLANGFGVILVAITADDKFLLSRRSMKAGARPGELDVTIVEGVHPELDRADESKAPDLYKTAVRGAMEEAGFAVTRDDITFLGFGVDCEYYQWNMLGVVRIDKPADLALDARSRGTGGKWEARDFRILDTPPEAVLDTLKNEKMWATAQVALYWALVHLKSKKAVEPLVEKVFGSRAT